MIEGMFNSGSMPALERLVQFTAHRHRMLSHNIANISTPHYQPTDLDPASFQEALGEAIDARRRRPGGTNRPLEMRDTRQLDFKEHGMEVKPQQRNNNILFHDRNNRSLERLMQHLAENAGVHNSSLAMLGNQFDMLQTAIQERV
jgi:flagellar basal-body rod protein FlgB